MLQDVIHPPEQLPDDDLSSPISAQIFDFCDPELFQETIQSSEVTSCSNNCYDENTSHASNLSLPQEGDNNTCQDNKTTTNATSTTTGTTTTATNATTNTSGNLSIIFDSQHVIENGLSASLSFSPSPQFSVPPYLPTQQDQYDFISVPPQVAVSDVAEGLSQYPAEQVAPLIGPALPPVFEDDCPSSVPSFVSFNTSSNPCSFLGPPIGTLMPGNANVTPSVDNSGIFTSNILAGSELHPQELEYQGDDGVMFRHDSIPRVFNAPDLQVLGTEGQQIMGGGASATPLASEITSLDDPIKVGKLSAEQRKEKIHRYMKKRNERNFSKKIKYACRKTLADSRPRVRGRFAKNDDFGEAHRNVCGHHEEEDDDEVSYIFNTQGNHSPGLVYF